MADAQRDEELVPAVRRAAAAHQRRHQARLRAPHGGGAGAGARRSSERPHAAQAASGSASGRRPRRAPPRSGTPGRCSVPPAAEARRRRAGRSSSHQGHANPIMRWSSVSPTDGGRVVQRIAHGRATLGVTTTCPRQQRTRSESSAASVERLASQPSGSGVPWAPSGWAAR